MKEVRRNHGLERDLQKLDTKIALLIANRTSIQEIDRQLRKKKRQDELPQEQSGTDDFSHDKKKMELYSNLFYCLQAEPRYLAKLAFVLPQEQTTFFTETLLLGLYGDAFSPREEYLILQLFKFAMEHEVANIKSPQDLQAAESVVPKLLLTYNERKQGVEYLKNTLTSVMKEMMMQEYNFELKPLNIYQKFLNDQEARQKDKKSKMKRDVTEDEAAKDPNVAQIMTQRVKELQGICQLFLNKILGTMTSVPYGLRNIARQIRQLLMDRFPKAKPDEIWNVVGYFTYYRFINPALVQPDKYDIGGRDLSLATRKNLVPVSKVLQTLFRLSTFPEKDELAPLNPWLASQKRAVVEYFADLVAVQPPEDYLQVNQYMELTQRSKPIVLISMKEVTDTHQIVKKHLHQIIFKAGKTEDPLQILINELGDVPRLSQEQGAREMQLQLENRFKGQFEEETKPGAHSYAETKELIIQVFKQIPVKPGQHTLISILQDAAETAKAEGNKDLGKSVQKIMKNFTKLEELNLISAKDNYSGLLKDVALEVTNRAERREQQAKEITRLQATLKNLKKHQDLMIDNIAEFEKYLDTCRKNSLARVKVKSKPEKFAYKDLQKRGVIIDSEVPELSRGKTKFFISMPDVGHFDIEAKIAGMSVGSVKLDLEDLLEKKESNVPSIELDQIVLNVPATIFLINKYFLS
jgi:Ras GTPase-activating-like protein IQGAP2/3